MKLYQLLQSFEFGDIFPEVVKMYPNAQLHRDAFEAAFDTLCSLRPVESKKVIRYQIMTDPDSGDMFYGAPDSCFNATWEVIVGKELKKEHGVDLNQNEIVANCLIAAIFIGRHPQSFEPEYRKLRRA